MRGSAYRAATVYGCDSFCAAGTEARVSAWHQSHTSMRLCKTDFTSVRRVRRGGGSCCVPGVGVGSAVINGVRLVIAVICCSGCACTMMWLTAPRNCIRVYSPLSCYWQQFFKARASFFGCCFFRGRYVLLTWVTLQCWRATTVAFRVCSLYQTSNVRRFSTWSSGPAFSPPVITLRASCCAVYCNRSCLWVCDSGRAGGRAGGRCLLPR